MIVYINHPNKLFSIALPKVVDGNYVLRDEDSSGNDRMLVNVVAKDGKWTIAGNKKISILNGESPVNDVVLEEYKELI